MRGCFDPSILRVCEAEERRDAPAERSGVDRRLADSEQTHLKKSMGGLFQHPVDVACVHALSIVGDCSSSPTLLSRGAEPQKAALS